MSLNTAIQWTDSTWNPVVGCSRISTGCKNCYAFKVHTMRHKAKLAGKKLPAQYAKPFTTIQPIASRLDVPKGWRTPRRIFVNSISDLFHEDVPFEFILEVWNTMAIARHHTYQILTKRPRRMLGFFEWAKEGMRERGLDEWEKGMDVLPNVWLGVSVENQAAADDRIPLLLQVPAAHRFLSCEPLVEWVNLENYLGPTPEDEDGAPYPGRINWVIAGGESGLAARPMKPDWARALRDECQDTGTAFFFKQWGEWGPYNLSRDTAEDLAKLVNRKTMDTPMRRHGKKLAGRMLDGREWNEYPEEKGT